jgi:hypothetical protein
MTDLTEFGGGSSVDPPRFKKKGRVRGGFNEKTGEQITAGWWGICPERDVKGFATSRRHDEHRFFALEREEGGSYAVSDDVLRKLDAMNLKRLFIVEIDTNRVLEYRVDDFVSRGRSVPSKYLHTSNDPQTYRTVSDARHRWGDHASSFWIPRDERTDYTGDNQ